MNKLGRDGTRRTGRGLQVGICVCGLVWAALAQAIAVRAASGLTVRFSLEMLQRPLSVMFFLFLVLLGFQVLAWLGAGQVSTAEALCLPLRLGWPVEWGLGAALGWGICLAAVLPMLLSGHLHSHLSLTLKQTGSLFLLVTTLLLVTLGQELVFRGYLLKVLTRAVGSSFAGLCSAVCFAAFLLWSGPSASVWTLVNACLLGLLLAIGALRTQAVWLGWGLHASVQIMLLVVLGLPVAGTFSSAAIFQSTASGPDWLSGGAYGIEGALCTVPVLAGALVVLFRATREYAWHYTYQTPTGAGYALVVPPPPAHVAMEQAAAPAALVQILPAQAPAASGVGVVTSKGDPQ